MDPESSQRVETISRLIEQASREGQYRAEELLPALYEELRALARARIAREPAQATIQATVLVHEAYLRLVGSEDPGWNGRGHFFGAAALAMRRILVEQARRRKRIKHGGGRQRVDLDEAQIVVDDEVKADIVAIDDILQRLEAKDPRKGQIVNLRYFAGLTVAETAEALGVSVGTVERDWRFIKAWIQDELNEGSADTPTH